MVSSYSVITPQCVQITCYEPSSLRKDTQRILMLDGLGVKPVSPSVIGTEHYILSTESYNGAAPALLAEMSGLPVDVVTQPAMSRSPHFYRGLYTKYTTFKQLQAGLEWHSEISPRPKTILLTHSLATLASLALERKDSLYSDLQHRIIGDILIAPFTSMQDALKEGNKERTLCGIPLYSLFDALQGMRLPCWYPLHAQYWHDGNEQAERHPAWKPSFWVSTDSAAYVLPLDGVALAEQSKGIWSSPVEGQGGAGEVSIPQRRKKIRECLVVVTEEDKIFPPSRQRDIATALGVGTVPMQSGHRWGTSSPDILSPVLEEIAAFIELL